MDFEKFMSYVEITDWGCWLWTGGKNDSGYGVVRVGKVFWKAHRYCYTLVIGPIPPRLELDHLEERGCRSRLCVAPHHLEPVTHAVNMARMGARRRARKMKEMVV